MSEEDTKSVSDDVELGEKRGKRYRRKRGHHHRHRRCNLVTVDDDGALNGAEKKKMRRNGERLGMAPSNTTQFLLEDREARAEAEQESAAMKCDSAERRRIRSISGGSDSHRNDACHNSPCTSSDSENELEKDREFEEKYQEVKLERIVQMSKEELAQELLDRDRDTETLHDRCEKIDSENRHLKELLSANGIPYEQPNSSVNHASKSPRVPAN